MILFWRCAAQQKKSVPEETDFENGFFCKIYAVSISAIVLRPATAFAQSPVLEVRTTADLPVSGLANTVCPVQPVWEIERSPSSPCGISDFVISHPKLRRFSPSWYWQVDIKS